MNSKLAALLCSAALAVPASAMYTAAPLPPAISRPATPVIIDAGHGGNDFGAVVKGLQEKDIALAVSLKLRDRLKGEMPVVMTRETDTFVTLDDRLVDAVDWNGAAFVSIHLNKVRNKKLAGATVYSFHSEPSRGRRRKHHKRQVPPMPAPPRVEARESAFLAEDITQAMRRDGFRVEEAKSDYYVLKNPAQPSVLIEIGYLSNPDEAARLADPAYQDKLVASIAKAVKAYVSDRALRAAEPAPAPSAAPHGATASAATAPNTRL